MAALIASNAVGLVVDSAIFLSLAFGSLDYLPGQVVGKAYAIVVSVAVLWAWRSRREARRV
jgi:hypothetical protein